MSRDVNKMGKFVREMGAIVDFKVSLVLNGTIAIYRLKSFGICAVLQ